MSKTKTHFGVIYIDEWNNTHSYYTKIGEIGDTIDEILIDFELLAYFDKEKLNSDEPRSAGTFEYGFYDIECFKKEEDDEEPEYNGVIKILEFIEILEEEE